MEIITKNNIKKYSTYKNSGVEWLGEIPEHWEVIKLKYLSEIKTGYTPITSDSSNFSKNGTIWAKPDNLNDFNLIKNSKEKVSSKGIKSQNIIPKNSILVCCIGTIGKFGIAGVDLITNQQINSIIFNTKISNKYGKYLIANCKSEFNKWANGNVVSILNTSAQKNIYFLLPPLSEQTKIAEFLDDKTEKIDEAIAIKTQQINLLKERKQILIHKAVTRGLDTNVKLKNSGVQWIGEIPVGWEVKRLKFTSKLISEKIYSKESQLDYIGMENIESWTGKFISTNSETDGLASSFKKGDVLFGKLRPYLAKVYLAEKNGICSTEFLVYRTDKIIFNWYLNLIMLSFEFIKLIDSSTYGSKMPRANSDFIGNQLIPIPPLSEQKEISSYIEKSSEKIATAIGLKSEEIEKLKEYKSSLINSVVTGKVRVC
ncbi:restriction endonuclease subunit S [Tenacibaculum piscium]|uniref:restriction endonuclease subunit S n=1 Tax=Tenacibaculum piscium TaxID=1458515 RepID=UPI00187B9BA4|nr:restriction endonuclease subunit S [Tenacibaculum piscium]MBE7670714.1 restriction endonuclease subunit S [Tenacibaculum piscium]